MDLLRLTELSEKYSENSLTESEKTELFSAINADSDLKLQFEENILLFNNLQSLKVEKLSRKWFEEVENEKKNAKITDLNLRTRIMHYVAVAAVSIFAVAGTLYFSGWFSYRKHLQAYTQLGNNVTSLTNNQKSMWDAFFSPEKTEYTFTAGTGFAISSEGYIVTSFHIVKDFDSIIVVNNIDSLVRYHADLVYNNIESDVAILKISDSTFSSFGKIPYKFNNKNSELGEYVYTLGYSKRDVVFGEGSVSSFTGFNEDSSTIQVSIPSNPGNSGGPLLNTKGDIIGMLCAKNNEIDGATFAVRSDLLLSLVDSLNSKNKNEQIVLPKYNNISTLDRPKQIKKIKSLIFRVEAY
ncbi:MAG: trypsin-like peptidase domain-containing protein [Bacteroidia bacterium]|nr:trypsin-like peptidase domain-containing protein [Bacteroidia bacterium]